MKQLVIMLLFIITCYHLVHAQERGAEDLIKEGIVLQDAGKYESPRLLRVETQYMY